MITGAGFAFFRWQVLTYGYYCEGCGCVACWANWYERNP